MVVGSCAAALLITTAGTAYAVDNLPPKQPLVQDLRTEGEACATGGDTPYVSEPPRISALLYDPEEDNQPFESSPVTGEFEAWWTDQAGAEQRRAYATTITLPSGSRFSWTMPDDIPANTVVSWHVRANDGEATSAWSDEGDGSVCSFVYDDVNPEKATLSSPNIPTPRKSSGWTGSASTATSPWTRPPTTWCRTGTTSWAALTGAFPPSGPARR